MVERLQAFHGKYETQIILSWGYCKDEYRIFDADGKEGRLATGQYGVAEKVQEHKNALERSVRKMV